MNESSPIRDPSRVFSDFSIVPASYIIFKKGDKTYAKNGETGEIEFQGTNAATVIQNAIDNLTSGRTWKETVIIKGNMGTLNSEIEIQSYIRLIGIDANITSTADYVFHGKDVSNVEIEGFKINHLGTGTFASAIFIEAIDTINKNIEIHNNEIISSKRAGIHINIRLTESGSSSTYGFKNIKIYNNYIHDLASGTEGTDGNGIYIGRGYMDNLQIVGNIVENTNSTAIVVGTASEYGIFNRVLISNNILINSERYHIDISGINRFEITKNLMYNEGADAEKYAIFIETAEVCQHGVISDNVINGYGGRGIYIYGQSTKKHQNICIANNILTRGIPGSSDPCRHIVVAYANSINISGNIIDGSQDDSSGSDGIRVESSVSDVLISNNRISSISTDSIITSGSEVIVHSNEIYQAGTYGVEVIGSNTNIICNHIYSTGGGYSIRLSSASSNTYIVENYVDKSFLLAGTYTIKRNIGYVTENSGTTTISSGNTSVSVSHGLASTPSKVIVTPKGDPGDRFWVANVGSSTFDIFVATAPGADIDFYWEAEV